MALIKCYECSAEISDKAQRCPKCGAPVIVHKWRCPKCGNTISEEPCPHCSSESISASVANITSDGNNAAAVPDFVTKNKRNLRILIFTLLAIASIVFVIVISQSGNGGSSGSRLDPNRTTEPCSFYGTTKVFGSAHTSIFDCYPDGDGYYWPSFEHHHHK